MNNTSRASVTLAVKVTLCVPSHFADFVTREDLIEMAKAAVPLREGEPTITSLLFNGELKPDGYGGFYGAMAFVSHGPSDSDVGIELMDEFKTAESQ